MNEINEIKMVDIAEAEKIADAVLKEENPTSEKPYKFRLLGAPDVFLMFKIIGKIGINEFTACFGKEGVVNVLKGLSEEEKADKTGEKIAAVAIALEAGHVILNNIGKCEKEVYALLAQTSNLSVEEITADGNAVMFVEMLIDFIQKDEFPNFISVASKLFK